MLTKWLLARAYCAKKAPKTALWSRLSEADCAHYEPRLLRAGFTSTAIFKLLKSWSLELPDDAEIENPDDDLPDF